MTGSVKCRGTGCPITYSLDIFGDRWTLLVLRDLLLFGKQRYRELQDAPEGIASNILSERLKRLEAAGIITRMSDPEDGRQVIYRATDKGRSLVPVLLEIAAWGATHDDNTGAPDAFAKSFYADREAFHANPAEMIAKVRKSQDTEGN